jgi:predicted amidohydrolase
MDARTVRVAAIQATPVVLDAAATVQKAVALIGEAASQGAELVVLPECFVPLFPNELAFRDALHDPDALNDVYSLMWHEAVEVPGPLVDHLVAACAAHQVTCVIGVDERDPGRSRSLFNTMLTLGTGGVLARHRKMMPTGHERLIHSFGRGDDLNVVDTPAGRVGGLICWENKMGCPWRDTPCTAASPRSTWHRPPTARLDSSR